MNGSIKKVFTILLVLAGIVGVVWAAKAWSLWRLDQKLAKFNADADNLILGLQQYKEFVGSYPTGSSVAISKALLGQSDKKILILAVRKSDLNDKGEILDPWGTPMEFYFSHNQVMVRSAGPNKVWEDSAVQSGDDLYRSTPKTK